MVAATTKNKATKKKATKKKATKNKATKNKVTQTGGRFKTWRAALQAPGRVEELVLDAKQLPRVTWPNSKPFPVEIGEFTNLRVLEVRARNLGGLCAELGTLEALESLSIDNSDEELEIGLELACLPALRDLELYNVGLRGFVPLPDSLESLSLQANDLLDVADWCEQLAALPRLRSLCLAQACAGQLPASIAKLPALRSLDLAQNAYNEVPSAVLQLTSLEDLALPVNQISSLPPKVGSLRALKVLSLQSNAISILPAEMRRLSRLEVLRLGCNPLQELPDWIGELPALRELDLRSAQLEDLPRSLTELPLERLWIDVPEYVLAELKQRLPDCEIINFTAEDGQREVEGWLKFFGKA